MLEMKRVALVLLLLPGTAPGQEASGPAPSREFLRRHCLSCHGPEKQKAQLRFDHLDGYRRQDTPLWTRIHQSLSSGAMPPEERPKPSDADRRALLAWIEKGQKDTRPAGTRRLNRRELAAALRELTGLGVDYAAALPGDGTVDGFDTGIDGLQDAADSVDQIVQVTRRAVESLRFQEPAGEPPIAIDFTQVKDVRKAFDPWKGRLNTGETRGIARPGTGVLLEPSWLGENGSFTAHVVASRRGVLRVTLEVDLLKPLPEVPNPHLWVEIGGKAVDYREIEGPATLVYDVQIEDLVTGSKGLAVSLSNKVEVPYAVEGFPNDDRKGEGKTPVDVGLFRPLYDKKALPVDRHPVPFVVLRRLELDPNHRTPWPAEPREALRLWTEKAHRRPAEADAAYALFTKLQKDGKTFDEALRAAFQSVLLGGPFRYQAVGDEWALASRLSFMLVGAPPDETLRRLAAAGKLRASLDGQVDRLLADSRSEAFFRPFVSQWLELGQPITLAMDHLQKQDFRFGRNLKASMNEETIAYVRELVAGNRPAKELISSGWTMMNDVLARHYGYEGVRGGKLRKLELRADDPRGGGLVGHAGIQSMLCWMGDNWVIYRGAWTLRHILDAPPPPPPLEVPELTPSDHPGKSFKEILQRHQKDPNCAVCHKSIDPLGFAFQNFDLSGRWRPVEFEKYEKKELDGKIEWRGVGRSRPVDAVGRLPRGEEFKSYAEWKELVARHYLEDVVRGLLKSLLLYGSGRKADVADLAEIRDIMKSHAAAGYPLRDLLKALLRRLP
jgi:mono/diheme cytochrome c family protein